MTNDAKRNAARAASFAALHAFGIATGSKAAQRISAEWLRTLDLDDVFGPLDEIKDPDEREREANLRAAIVRSLDARTGEGGE